MGGIGLVGNCMRRSHYCFLSTLIQILKDEGLTSLSEREDGKGYSDFRYFCC